MYKKGDWVIYRVSKVSSHPGPRAEHVSPEPRGEHYTYDVDKFWVVDDLEDHGKVRLRTRRGKAHVIEVDNPRLRHASWWERIWYRDRFPQLAAEDEVAQA